MSRLRGDELSRIVLTVIVIGALMATTFWVLRPFLGAIIWATMIVVATWPVMIGVQRRAGGRRWLAVTVMSVILLLVLVVPLSAAIGTVVSHVDDIVEWAKGLRYRTSTARNQALPHWLRHYNQRRPHSSLGGRPPISRAHDLPGQDS